MSSLRLDLFLTERVPPQGLLSTVQAQNCALLIVAKSDTSVISVSPELLTTSELIFGKGMRTATFQFQSPAVH